MIVYVESNFVLEIALGQEESAAARLILDLAASGRVELVVPSIALTEPFATITYRGRQGIQLSNTLRDRLRDLLRSEPHRGELQAFESVPETLARVYGYEMRLLETTVGELLECARIVELTKAIFGQALAFESRLGLSPQDAIIYSSVLQDLQSQRARSASIFVSRNFKDFGDPEIRTRLRGHRCRYVDDYTEAAEIAGRVS